MAHPRPVLGLAKESLHRDRIAGEAMPEDFHRRLAALAVFRAIDSSGAALADILGEVVTGHRPTHQIVSAHGMAKLVNLASRSKLDA
jgi:hypothetical protein